MDNTHLIVVLDSHLVDHHYHTISSKNYLSSHHLFYFRPCKMPRTVQAQMQLPIFLLSSFLLITFVILLVGWNKRGKMKLLIIKNSWISEFLNVFITRKLPTILICKLQIKNWYGLALCERSPFLYMSRFTCAECKYFYWIEISLEIAFFFILKNKQSPYTFELIALSR